MGKAEDKRAEIIAKQAAREAVEREARRLAGPPTPPRKPRAPWGGGAMRGRPRKTPE